MKNAISNLIGITLIYRLPWYDSHFENNDSSNPITWYIFPCVCIIFDFSNQHLTVFGIQVFCLLVRFIPRYFILFGVMINGMFCSLFWFFSVIVSEKTTAPHSSTLAWKIPWTGELGGLPSMGSHRVGHDWRNLAAAATNTFTLIQNWRKNMQVRRKKICRGRKNENIINM